MEWFVWNEYNPQWVCTLGGIISARHSLLFLGVMSSLL